MRVRESEKLDDRLCIPMKQKNRKRWDIKWSWLERQEIRTREGDAQN